MLPLLRRNIYLNAKDIKKSSGSRNHKKCLTTFEKTFFHSSWIIGCILLPRTLIGCHWAKNCGWELAVNGGVSRSRKSIKPVNMFYIKQSQSAYKQLKCKCSEREIGFARRIWFFHVRKLLAWRVVRVFRNFSFSTSSTLHCRVFLLCSKSFRANFQMVYFGRHLPMLFDFRGTILKC